MQVDSLMVNEGAAAYYTDDLRNVLEDFMTVFRTDGSTQPMQIDPGVAVRFEADLYGLLTYLKIPKQFHYAVMRVNKLVSSDDYRSHMTNLLIPNTNEIQRILQTQNSTNRVTN
jgi:hypothetical protein